MKRCMHWIDDRNPTQHQLFTIWCLKPEPQRALVWAHYRSNPKGPYATFKRTRRGRQRTAEKSFIHHTQGGERV